MSNEIIDASVKDHRCLLEPADVGPLVHELKWASIPFVPRQQYRVSTPAMEANTSLIVRSPDNQFWN